MFSFNFSQILGLLLFFFGLIILNRCSQAELKDYMTRSLPDRIRPARSDFHEREITRQLIRKSLVYSLMGVFVCLWGMVMFFVSL
jgi:drug/metabolite transporter (DMT)-like permease